MLIERVAIAAAPDAPTAPRPGWIARLRLKASHDAGRTVAHAEHEGPLRVLKALYPEGPALCQHTLVHPPSGIVGGDQLHVDVALGERAQLLLTTPGAARFYRSEGALAEQHVSARLAAHSRLEWLPQETLVFNGARALNHLRFELAAGAEMIGWDLLALGLPAAGKPFEQGFVDQHIELPGVWLERGRIAANDALLLNSPLGMAGHGVLGTLWWAAGAGVAEARCDAALQAAREVLDRMAHQGGLVAAATCLVNRVVVVRLLAHHTEPAMALMRSVRAALRCELWQLQAVAPRLWST